jgi:quercetin dioxygenase-like cupin family protein
VEVLASKPTGKGPAETFTGDVWVDEIAIADEPSRLRVYKVRFAPGARTAWHSHALGPTPHVIDGVGRVQSRGGEVIEIRTGDTIYTPPGEWHLHGATPDRFMAHFAIAEAPALGDGGADPVSADDDPGAGLKRLAVTGPADDAGDVAVAVSFDVSYGDAELHVDAGGGGCVHDDRVEHGAPGRVQGVHAVRRLDGDRYDGVGVAERRPVYRGGSGGDDLVEQAPPGQLEHPAAHQRVRRESVAAVAAAVDEEYLQPEAGEQVGGGRARHAGADDHHVVAGAVARAHVSSPGLAAGDRGGAGVGDAVPAEDVLGDHGRVAADAADEVRPATVLEALAEHVEARYRRAAAVLADLAVLIEQRQPQPGVGTAMTGGPHDGVDTGGAEVEVCDDAGGGKGSGPLRAPRPVRRTTARSRRGRG